MERQHVFPGQALAEGLSEPSINLEGQRVVFDKKVSLLPADVRKEDPAKNKNTDERARRNGTV